MLKAHALYFSLVISLLLAVMCSSLILFHQYTNKEQLIYKQKEQLIQQVESGVAIATLSEQAISSDTLETKTIDWGLYKVATARGFNNRDTLTKSVLLGSKFDNNTALYLAENNHKLILCGNTKIKGNGFLPKAGVTRGYIAGKSYVGSKLIYGTSQNSSAEIPFIDFEKFISIVNSLPKNGIELDSNSLIHSYSKESIVLTSPSRISGNYKGNIILASNKPVSISSRATLDNIILMAPSITIERNFEGNLQCFASDEIIVNENCKLTYPSVLGLLKQESNDTIKASITIGKGSDVKGVVIAHQQAYDRSGTLISIAKGAEIEGEIISSGSVELKGTVKGMVSCKSFYLHTRSSVYENYILDATIDRSQLNDYYYSSVLSKNILKWPIKRVQ